MCEDEIKNMHQALQEHIKKEATDRDAIIKHVKEAESRNQGKDSVAARIDRLAKQLVQNQNAVASSTKDVDQLDQRQKEQDNFCNKLNRATAVPDGQDQHGAVVVQEYYEQLVSRLEEDVKGYQEHIDMIHSWQQDAATQELAQEDEDVLQDVLESQVHVFKAMSAKLWAVHKDVEESSESFNTSTPTCSCTHLHNLTGKRTAK